MPVWREAAGIEATLRLLQPLRTEGHELIVVDGGSDDDTAALAQLWCDRLLIAEPGRARQMNAGAKVACGEVLLFLHADTCLPDGALTQAAAVAAGQQVWGRFDVRLSGQRALGRGPGHHDQRGAIPH